MNIITWLWPGRAGYTGERVNALARMIARHYPHPHRVKCVTNTPAGIDSELADVIPDREDFAHLQSPHGAAFPSCYRRLRAFDPDAAQWFGPRFVSIDLDVVAVRDLSPLWNRPEPFVAYRDPLYGGAGQYCGSMMLLSAGAMPQVWNGFLEDPTACQRAAAAAGFRGSDQAWISYAARGAPTWTTYDGVYSYRVDIQRNGNRLPSDARLTIWHGGPKPWREGRALPWVREHL